ncbi:MAG TPA: hypothetical protein DIT35_02745 [Rhodospirillaceae bacterium]|nr:hypothetical protein [Rhodospirillaceae bacterium]
MSDPSNPSGALPGDPRYGLSAAELEDYYRNKSPSWICKGYFRADGGLNAREAAMDVHQAYLRATEPQIRFSGPLLTEDGSAPSGAMALIDAPNRAAAQAWMDNEGYSQAGAFSEISITRWSSSMALRYNDYPRTEGWEQFVITAIDGLEAEARRAAVADAHHKYQASVMDRYVARGPMFNDEGTQMIGSMMIMEYPDREACDFFWEGEPLNYGGVFSEVTIERWRYGITLPGPTL